MDPPPPAAHPFPAGNNATPSTTPSPSSSATAKLRLMCSYGGQIVPRSHDKSFCYVGGETRIVAVERRTGTSFSALTAHLSRALFSERPFVLKYQLPNHDLDSLISIASDEDLANMVDEYDRLTSSSLPSSVSSSTRIRFFLFPAKSDATSTDYDARSEAWFFDALRSASIATGKAGSGVRSSDTSSMEGLGLGDTEGKAGDPAHGQGVGLVAPDSILLERTSSYGSTGSGAASGSNSTRPAGGGEEVQLQKVKVNNKPLIDSIESESSSLASPSLQSPTLVYLDAISTHTDVKEAKGSINLIDTESDSSDISTSRPDVLKSAHQVVGYPVSQAMDQQLQQSPPSQTPLPQTAYQQQPQAQPTLQSYTQPQYIHTGSHFVTQYYHPSAIQGTSYSTTYQPFLQNQQQAASYQLNKPYQQVYLVPVGQAQTHDMTVPCNLTGQTTSLSPTLSRPLNSNPTMMVASPVVYDNFSPAQSATDLATTKLYRTAKPVSLASDEQQQQFVAASQLTHTSQVHPVQAQTVTVPSSVVENANYSVDFEDSLHAQIYKTQPSAPALTSQFQPATNAATVMLSESLAQLFLCVLTASWGLDLSISLRCVRLQWTNLVM